MRGGEAGGGEHGSAEGEGKSEDGVLPLDHFEGDAEVVEDGHGSRVSVLGSVVRGQWPVVSGLLGSRFRKCKKLHRESCQYSWQIAVSQVMLARSGARGGLY